ncbi:MAG: hemerythrin domain-containing protein [Nitrospira sp.]|nr:hemerythrin domain-containing protein [Nitrospira sp.]
MANHTDADAKVTIITLMLREDHQKIAQLFHQFNETPSANEKRTIVTEAIAALEVHATLEEELIYPAWQQYIDTRDLMNEAFEEHHLLGVLIKEIKYMDPENERYNAKFRVLSEHVTRHINEEEAKIFPRAERAQLDWDHLAQHVLRRRQMLEQKDPWILGVPVSFSSRATRGAARAALPGRSGG